jgi:hypothetical protein
LLALWIGTVCWDTTARAGISFVDMFRNGESVQIADGNSLTPFGSFFSSDLNSVNPNDYISVTMSFPGPGSPLALSQVSSTQFSYQTGFFASQAAMDATFPTGTYSFSATNGGTPDTASFVYATPDFYPQSPPFFSGTTYTALQGMSASQDFTFQLSPFNTGSLPAGSMSNIFLTIFDVTKGQYVFNDGFLPSTTTSILLPANTLTAGDQYEAQLIFDNRIFVPSPGAQFNAEIGFDLRTDVSFSAAVPEPGALALFAPSIALLTWLTFRRRRPR